MKNAPPLSFFDQIDNYLICQDRYQDSTYCAIPGLKYIPNFITEQEEANLITLINEHEWLTDLTRRVQHYGWKYDYRARFIDHHMRLGPLPYWAQALSMRLKQNGLINEIPDQIIVNEYKPGQGIANHVDCEPCFGDTIISLSLASACAMNFVNLQTKERQELILAPRSVVCMQSEARYKWSHGIASRLADDIFGVRTNRKLRLSITFRKVIN